MFCYRVLSVISDFVLISFGKREVVALLLLCSERADLLALVCGVFCEFVTFPLVSWVRCGT